jgi:spermidine/putrescine transport system ATP-binding protein
MLGASHSKPEVRPTDVPAVELRGVEKKFGDSFAVAGIDLSIKQGEFFSLLGPSGCGKTTLLRMVAGLDFPTAGEVLICGQDVISVPAHERPVNTVFQSYALFPHMTVRENVAFGLKMKKIAPAEIARRVDKIMELVQIAKFADRKPHLLSGGQRQRVALARAVVNEPQVLLLDEPLGALDLKLRKELQIELIRLQRSLGITFICVTHDQEEALTMSDRIAVMNGGCIEQMGSAEELYENPRTRFVGSFLGTCNFIEAVVSSRTAHGAVVQSPVGALNVEFRRRTPASERERFTLGIRPEKVTLHDTPATHGENCIAVTVKELLYIGSETHYQLDAAGVILGADSMNSKVGSQGFELGQTAYAYLPADGLVVLDD